MNAPTVEHIIPRGKGGTDKLDNIVIACWRGNNASGNGEAL
jgi:5-methylcytosine-specific restriction endonuclease McrA